MHADEASSSSPRQRRKTLRTPSGRAGAAVGASRASRTPDCGLICVLHLRPSVHLRLKILVNFWELVAGRRAASKGSVMGAACLWRGRQRQHARARVLPKTHLNTTPRKSREFRSRLFVNGLAHAELLVVEKRHHGAGTALTRTKKVGAVSGAPLTVTSTVCTSPTVPVTFCTAPPSVGQAARSVEVSTE